MSKSFFSFFNSFESFILVSGLFSSIIGLFYCFYFFFHDLIVDIDGFTFAIVLLFSLFVFFFFNLCRIFGSIFFRYFLFIAFSLVSFFVLFVLAANTSRWFSLETIELYLGVMMLSGSVWAWFIGFVWLRSDLV